MGDHPVPDPRGVDPGTDRVDHPGHLPPGHGGQVGQRERSTGRAGADERVQHVDAGGAHRDAYLVGPGLRVGNLVEHEVLGRSELVEADGAHVVVSGGWRRGQRYDLKFT